MEETRCKRLADKAAMCTDSRPIGGLGSAPNRRESGPTWKRWPSAKSEFRVPSFSICLPFLSLSLFLPFVFRLESDSKRWMKGTRCVSVRRSIRRRRRPRTTRDDVHRRPDVLQTSFDFIRDSKPSKHTHTHTQTHRHTHTHTCARVR